MILTQYISTSQLAKILNLSRIAVYKKIKSGKIKAIKIGRNFFVEKDNLPEITGKTLGIDQKNLINQSVIKTIKEYGEALKLLGKE